jgi:hypothetical protein
MREADRSERSRLRFLPFCFYTTTGAFYNTLPIVSIFYLPDLRDRFRNLKYKIEAKRNDLHKKFTTWQNNPIAYLNIACLAIFSLDILIASLMRSPRLTVAEILAIVKINHRLIVNLTDATKTARKTGSLARYLRSR